MQIPQYTHTYTYTRTGPNTHTHTHTHKHTQQHAPTCEQQWLKERQQRVDIRRDAAANRLNDFEQ